ncbi:MAG: acetylglucosamine-6-sulfatase [Pirellulaceae bacterium]|nr:MAG: acetylglucosamine-6-sulfatase [Pirellulaceae bacterium]
MGVNRGLRFGCVWAVVIWIGCVAGETAGAQPPNILFIYADDHSPKTVSCYPGAYPMARTPNIDALAARGVRFQGAYLGSWCMPSRASLLTGHHPHAIQTMRMEGPYPGSTYDPQVCRFWPATFREHGYHTAQIGKWHTGTDAGFGRDWDFQVVWNRPKHPDNAPKYYGPQILAIQGEERLVEGYSTDIYTDYAERYIRGEFRDPQKPWFLWLCYGAIHGPTIPADRHRGFYRDREAQPPVDIFGPRPGKPRYLEKTQVWHPAADGSPQLPNGVSYVQWLRQVNECMLAVDEGVGRLVRALQETGQWENTIVIYSSDQGFANGEHGMRQKVAPYDATYRSPLIVSFPARFPQGKYCSHAVNAPDLVVTFFSLAGLELPWKMHGRDLTPLLENPERDEWPATLFEHTGQHYGTDVAAALRSLPAIHSNVPYFVAVCYRQYKFVRYIGDHEPDELYDLDRDPEELHNLAGLPEYRPLCQKLEKMLQEELRRTDGNFLLELGAKPQP